MKKKTRIPSSLMAPCGMNCGICMAYLRPKNKCAGCLSKTGKIAGHCAVCSIRNCGAKPKVSSFCFDCAKYPCARLKHLDKRYRTRYGMSMLDNLNAIQARGITAFMKKENTRWACGKCGKPVCVHNKTCYFCKD